MRTSPLLIALALLPACGGDPGSGDDVVDHDAAAAIDGAPGAPDADPSRPDAGACGTESPPLAMISGTEGIAIAADGTIYYSQSGYVGRWVPGAATAVDQWVALAGATTVWGMAIAPDGMLYVASPTAGGKIFAIDTTTASPAATDLYPSAGSANGLTLGPDGAIYYGNFATNGHIYRLTTAGARMDVTLDTFRQPNGVLFDDDGTLLVLEYGVGEIWRVTLGGINNVEISRTMVAEVPDGGNPDGLARDDQGRYYVTDNSGGVVLRYDADFANPISLLPDVNVGSAANMAFGRGALDCDDLFVTSSGPLRQLDAGATGVP